MFQHFNILAPRSSSGARSSLAFGAVFAIAAIGIFSGTLVGSELIGAPSAHAKTPALAWELEARWWPGEVPQAAQPAPARTEADLTFSKGYAQRVAARQAAQAARLASLAPTETQLGRPAVIAPKASAVARGDNPQEPRRAMVTSSDITVHRDGLDFRTEALAFGEPQPRGAAPQNLFGNLFGTRNLF